VIIQLTEVFPVFSGLPTTIVDKPFTAGNVARRFVLNIFSL